MIKEDKLNVSKELVWIYKGKSTKLGNMSIYNLNLTLNYLNKNPNSKQFGKSKSNWIEAIKEVLKHKDSENMKHIANKLMDIRYKKANIFVTKLCDNIKQMKFINQLKQN